MTLSQRNRYFKAGIIVSSACLLGILYHLLKLIPLYAELAESAVQRAEGLVQYFAARFFPIAPLVPFVSVIAAVVYTLGASLLMYFFFEKTHSPEILFFGLFSFSFVFEVFRLIIPLKALYGFSPLFLVLGAKGLFFGRFFGVLSFFAASVYAAGFELQKQGTVIIAIAIATLILSLGVPVDGLVWNTNMVMLSGYTSVFRLAEAGILVISVVSFFVAAHTRGAKEYIYIGIGALLLTLGRDLLLSADTWINPIPGFIMLCAGIWISAAKLHQVYLWL